MNDIFIFLHVERFNFDNIVSISSLLMFSTRCCLNVLSFSGHYSALIINTKRQLGFLGLKTKHFNHNFILHFLFAALKVSFIFLLQCETFYY